MICPDCNVELKCKDSRQRGKIRVRVYECESCGTKYHSEEHFTDSFVKTCIHCNCKPIFYKLSDLFSDTGWYKCPKCGKHYKQITNKHNAAKLWNELNTLKENNNAKN